MSLYFQGFNMLLSILLCKRWKGNLTEVNMVNAHGSQKLVLGMYLAMAIHIH